MRVAERSWLGRSAIRRFKIVKVDKSPDPVVKAGKDRGVGKKLLQARCVTQVFVSLSQKTLISSVGNE